ncbi:efflux RND transporter periplasmic adaptor subunit [Maritimibacter sp. HL-12]|uniref:efflux RND transporter periplasmic adaptor subunit n=1 Tax=Maritimibacter sp. HL-12 TaxID=1162418 RepID=UPI000A0EF523|nr:HlyD family efflux transporter periplasmic adaptor subunit [Maritimibacter sp. HL-12]SMH52295.1 HlyD family secretion protein [Maritimibacter sp. HL-12]
MAFPVRKIVFGALVAGGLGVAAWQLAQPEYVPVDLASVTRGPLEVTVNGDGMTRIRDVFEVSAPVSGQVLRSPVKVGDDVVSGETVVALIEPGEPAFLDERARAQAEAAVAQARAAQVLSEANLRAAEADMANAQRQFDRVFALHGRGTASDTQLEQAEVALDLAAAQFDSAQANLTMRESEVASAEAVLIEPGVEERATGDGVECCITLKAPVSGQVLNVTNESARMVTAGTPLLTIGPPNDLEITVDLLSTDAVRIAPGVRAYVERWGGSEALEAQVRQIEPAAFTKVSALGIEEQRVRVLLDFVTAPEARPALGHNFRVYLRIVEWQGDDVRLVPISALFREGGDWAVFTLDGEAARLAPVEIGRRNTEFAEVLDGLAEGDRVITHPSDRVDDGVLVVDRETLE